MSKTSVWRLEIGASLADSSQTRFRVWAPHATSVAVRLRTEKGEPFRREPVPLEPGPWGYFEAAIPGVTAGTRYTYLLDRTKERPDPASRFQPDGVHGPSAVVDPAAFRWTDAEWVGLPRERLIVYELHTGAFTAPGTFEGIIPCLDYLRDQVGVTAIELMPVAQFPGARNWGYDGAYLYAPQSTYGGPWGLKALVDACHAKGLAVILDVVYNHLGPEGNYLADFGPYFTDHYRTPWGTAINYDGPHSDEVRHFFLSNALYWVVEYHVDGLRLDAVHGIFDLSATHILRELTEAVHAEAARQGRSVLVIAESDLNDARVIAPAAEGGYGLDAQWNDDFHHALHALLTGEQAGYYEDFGRLDQLATAVREGFVYSGERSAHRRRRHGNSVRHRPPSQFVVCTQNHDQVGNRARGDRLSTLVPFDALKVAAAAVLLAPNLPLLFMGEEYAVETPFQYFTDNGDPALVEAVRMGRGAEFASFGWQGEVPDPQDPATFECSRLHTVYPMDAKHAAMLKWYQSLIGLRKTVSALGAAGSAKHGCQVWTHEPQRVIVVHRWVNGDQAALVVLGFNHKAAALALQEPTGTWTLRLASSAEEFRGTGPVQPPATLIIGPEGASLDLPPYPALLYMRNPGQGR